LITTAGWIILDPSHLSRAFFDQFSFDFFALLSVFGLQLNSVQKTFLDHYSGLDYTLTNMSVKGYFDPFAVHFMDSGKFIPAISVIGTIYATGCMRNAYVIDIFCP
jgi:hypothetical protein